MWYLIRHKADGRYISGTEFAYDPTKNRQILSDEKHPPMLFAEDRIKLELLRRSVNMDDFEVVRADVTPAEVVEIDFEPYYRR